MGKNWRHFKSYFHYYSFDLASCPILLPARAARTPGLEKAPTSWAASPIILARACKDSLFLLPSTGRTDISCIILDSPPMSLALTNLAKKAFSKLFSLLFLPIFKPWDSSWTLWRREGRFLLLSWWFSCSYTGNMLGDIDGSLGDCHGCSVETDVMDVHACEWDLGWSAGSPLWLQWWSK